MRIGIAADHGGFELKVQLTAALKAAGYEVTDFGAHELFSEDDYPDFVAPLARAVARGEVTRGLAICGSGVGACVATNKVPGEADMPYLGIWSRRFLRPISTGLSGASAVSRKYQNWKVSSQNYEIKSL